MDIQITDIKTGAQRNPSLVAKSLLAFVNAGDFSPQERYVLSGVVYDNTLVQFDQTFDDDEIDTDRMDKARHESMLQIAKALLGRIHCEDFDPDELIDASLWTPRFFLDILRVLLVAADNDKDESARLRAKFAALKIINARG